MFKFFYPLTNEKFEEFDKLLMFEIDSDLDMIDRNDIISKLTIAEIDQKLTDIEYSKNHNIFNEGNALDIYFSPFKMFTFNEIPAFNTHSGMEKEEKIEDLLFDSLKREESYFTRSKEKIEKGENQNDRMKSCKYEENEVFRMMD